MTTDVRMYEHKPTLPAQQPSPETAQTTLAQPQHTTPANALQRVRAASAPTQLPTDLLVLQKKLGNRAVGRLLQAKLTVNSPGDQYEQEADHVVNQVMRMTDPAVSPLQRKCACGGDAGPAGECEACREKRIEVQRVATGQAEAATAPPIVHDVLGASGQPLDQATRAFFEPRFGYDLSQVRVHTDAQAGESAKSVNALAYTVHRDIVFGPGQYAPDTPQGQHLLAHELVHVVQQTGGVRTKRQLGEVSDPYKQTDVRAMEQMITRSWPAESSKISEAPSGAVQRVAGVDDAAELGVLLWCVSGALTTIAIDEAIQGISWLWKGGNFRQNWCKTLFSALFGCIFGVAGGAFGKMFLSEGVAITTSAMLRWLIKKAITAGFTQLAGKLGLILAKSGCDQQEKVADATPAPDTEGAMDTSETAMA